MKKIFYIISLVLIFNIFIAVYSKAELKASTYYVSTTGNDANAGSEASPWKTIQFALDSMTGGDDLKISAGTYNESVRLKNDLDGTSGDRTIIEPLNVNDVVIVTADTNTEYVMRVESDYTTVKNITFDGKIPLNSVATGSSQCVIAKPGTAGTDLIDVKFESVKVKNCASHGLELGGTVISDVQYFTSGSVVNSTVESALMNNYDDSKGSWGSGLKIYRGGKDILLSGNIVRNNWGEGIAVTRGENVTVENNTVYNNFAVNIYIDNSINTTVESNFSYCIDDSTAILKDGKKASGIGIGEEYYSDTPLWGNQLSKLNVSNNIVYSCSRGFGWYGTDNSPETGGLDDTLIANNTFYLTDNATSAIYIEGEVGDDIEFKNNIIVTNSTGAWISNILGTYDFDYNLWADSKSPSQEELNGTHDIEDTLESIGFVSAPGFTPDKFNISSDSSAIDKAIQMANILTDYLGNQRGTTPDIGAYEFNASTSEELIANFLINNAFSVTVTTNDTVSFKDTSTGNIVSWEWDFDNNGVIDSTLQNPTYKYTMPGIYDVTLKITDANGNVSVTKNNAVTVIDLGVSVPVYRFKNNDLGGAAHFYVVGEANKNSVIEKSKSGGVWEGVFTYETVAFNAYPYINSQCLEDTIPVYRFLNNKYGSIHFYVIGESNKQVVINNSKPGGIWAGVFTYEIEAFCVYDTSKTDTTAVYRFRNNSLGGSVHFYVVGDSNRDIVINNSKPGGIWSGVFTYETASFYVPID